MAVEEITLSRAYVRGLNDEIKRLQQLVAELEAGLARATAAKGSRDSESKRGNAE